MVKSKSFPTKKVISAFVLFLALLAYFVFGNGWYIPADLRIEGTAQTRTAQLAVLWDSGEGWNRYERRIFRLQPPPPGDHGGKHRVRIRSLGLRHVESMGDAVICSQIIIDGKEIDLDTVSHDGKRMEKGIRISGKGGTIRLSVSAREHIRLVLLTNAYSGKAEVSLNGRAGTVDLYSGNQEAKNLRVDYWLMGPNGRFALTLALPRYDVDSLAIHNLAPKHPVRLQSVAVISEKGRRTLNPLPEDPLQEIRFPDISRGMKKHFSPPHFAFQTLSAMMTAWLLLTVHSQIVRCGGLKAAVVERKRWIFWLLSGAGFGVYSLWLAAFWPGILSVDSLKVWRAAMLPEVLVNDHPLLFVLFYAFLQQLWHHVAVVPIFHIVVLSLFTAYLVFTLFRHGVSLKLLIPFYLFLLFSIPVGLYNIVLWKDIPFALAIVVSGFILAELYRKSRIDRLHLSVSQLAGLFFLFLALCFIRHNGLVYLITIPALLVLLRIVSVKKAFATLIAVSVAAGALFLTLVVSDSIDGSGFLLKMGNRYLRPALDRSVPNELRRTTRQYWGILDINQTQSRWDLWNYYLQDRMAYRFLQHAGWNDVYPYLGKEPDPLPKWKKAAMQLYWKTYEKPWVYLTWNPFYLLALFPLTILLAKWFPLSAIFSSVVLIQVFALLGVVNILNWRYYYFAYLGALFMPFMILWDLKRMAHDAERRA